VLLAAYFAVTAVIGGRLVVVQVLAAEQYQALGERQTQREVTLPAGRGRLYDRTGAPLALSEPAAAVYANPQAIEQADTPPREIARALARHLDLSQETLSERLTRKAGFVYLSRQLPRDVGEAVRAERLPGVGVLEEPIRRYPNGSLAAAVLGYVGIDHRGLAGLELAHDAALAGQTGTLRVERAPGGVPISNAPREVEPAVPGDDLMLTLDRRIQLAAEDALSGALDTHQAKAGAAVVLDADTAEVLAMASVPGFDPADLDAAEPAQRRNRPVTDAFEPGSVAKVVTFAAAIEAGVASQGQRWSLPAELEVGGTTFTDPSRSETTGAALDEIVANSSNVGTIKIAQQLGRQRLHDAFAAFGVGTPTGIEFPGETDGSLPPVADWWATSLPTIAIGQGVSVSLLQLAGMMQTLANDGQRIAPTLVRGEIDPTGRLRPVAAPPRHQAVSAETAAVTTRLLNGVVERGTGQRADVEGYAVAGKTGTAQKPHPDRRGYQQGAYLGTFAGFAPADNPEIAVAVVLDEPDPIWGGQTAAPVFADIAKKALQTRRVAPQQARSPQFAAGGASKGQP
jgi:cell division protein FtsI (penicillin-binding protein 3)